MLAHLVGGRNNYKKVYVEGKQTVYNMQETVEQLEGEIRVAEEPSPEDYGEHTKKVMTAANQVLKYGDKEGCTALGTAIIMLTRGYLQRTRKRICYLALHCEPYQQTRHSSC